MDDFERRFALKLGNYTLLKINPKKCLHNTNDSYLNPLKIYGSTVGLSSFNLKIIEKKINTFEKFLFLKSVNLKEMCMTQILIWIRCHFCSLHILDPDLDQVRIKIKWILSTSFYNLHRFILYPENL